MKARSDEDIGAFSCLVYGQTEDTSVNVLVPLPVRLEHPANLICKVQEKFIKKMAVNSLQ